MTIVATLYDGRTVARTTVTQVVAGSTPAWLQFTFSELDKVEYLLNVIGLTTDPKTTTGAWSHYAVTNNVVGVTLESPGAGTTLTAGAIAIGI